MVALTGITLGICHWNIRNLNVDVTKSDLRDVYLNVTGMRNQKTNTLDQSTPTIHILNSSLNNFHGHQVHLKMIGTYTFIKTNDIVTSMFMMKSSTAEIVKCTFIGSTQPKQSNSKLMNEYQHAETDDIFGSAIFYIESGSEILITECMFEDIHLDEEQDLSMALHSVESQVNITRSIFNNNSAKLAVISVEASNIKVLASVFQNNSGQSAAIYIQQNSRLDVQNSTFKANTDGSSIAAKFQASVYIIGSVFSNNTAQIGASINVQQNSSKLNVCNSTFTDNKAEYGAGILAASQASAYVVDSVFLRNSANQGASINMQDNTNLEVYSSTFIDNHADLAGGILAFNQSSAHVTCCVFSHNSGQYAAAISVEQNASLQVHNTTFTDNKAMYGPAIEVDVKVSASITDSSFENNTALRGGAIFIDHYSHLKAIKCVFYGNKATKSMVHHKARLSLITNGSFLKRHTLSVNHHFKSAMVSYPVSKIKRVERKHNSVNAHRERSTTFDDSEINDSYVSAGAISVSRYSTLSVRHCRFIKNTALLSAGAIYAAGPQVDSNPSVYIVSCIFMNNEAQRGGGLVSQINNTVSITNSTFIANSAIGGGAITGIQGTTLYIDTTKFVANTVSTGGAAFVFQTNASATITDCVFSQNKAESDGAVIWATFNNHIKLNRCHVSENTAIQGSVFWLLSTYLYSLNTNYFNHSSNMIYMKSSELILNACHFANNSLMHTSEKTMIHIEGESMFVAKKSNFTQNHIVGIIDALSSPVSISRCNFINNAINGSAMINTADTMLIIDNSFMRNNTVNVTGCIMFRNAIITSSTFINNTVASGFGLLNTGYMKTNLTLQLIHCNFLENREAVLMVVSKVDVSIDSCVFKGNYGTWGTLQLVDQVSLRTSNTVFTAPIEGNKVALYFVTSHASGKELQMTDYLTHEVSLVSGNITLKSSSSHNFLQEAEDAGLIYIDKQKIDYYVTQEETVFASGKNFLQ